MSIFKGSGVALVTPFKIENNKIEVDYDNLKRLLEFHLKNDTDSIIICGTTGEASTLDDDEHLKCIEECVKYINKKIPVISGTGSNNTEHAIYMSKEAEKLGSDALLCVTPYYNKTNQEGLKKYYKSISDNVNIPVIMYNVPSRTGVNILPETAKEIRKENKNIVAIKEASGNISQVANLSCDNKLDIYSGNDDQILPILSLGGIGVISVIANIFPKEIHNLVYSYLNGDIKEARKLQIESLKLCRALFSDVNPIPIKKATQIMNLTNGILKEPLISLDSEKTKILRKEIDNYKKLNK